MDQELLFQTFSIDMEEMIKREPALLENLKLNGWIVFNGYQWEYTNEGMKFVEDCLARALESALTYMSGYKAVPSVKIDLAGGPQT